MNLPKFFQFIYKCACIYIELPAHLTFDLERVMYSHGPSLLLGVTTKKVLNRDSIPNKSDVSYVGYELLEALRETHHCVYLILTHTGFFNVFVSNGDGPIRTESHAFTMHHFDFDINCFVL